jgi:thioesterase domain-containing protein/acyl carrier protein
VQHATGTVSVFEAPPPPSLPLDDLQGRSSVRVVHFEEGQQLLPQDQYLSFGPRWRVIREMRFGRTDAVARLSIPERFAVDLATFGLHPGVLDMVSGFAFSLADPTSTSDRLRVPLSYQRVRIHAPLEREIVSYVRLKQASDDGLAVFDVWVANSEGRVLCEVQGYTTKSVPPGTLFPAARAAKEPTLLERWTKLGITHEEGAGVVERLLGVSPPAELYASPVSLFTLLEQLQPRREPAVQAGRTPAASVERTESQDAPRDDVERRLADMWCSLLGVESVGIRDNFFELGGHSLIAVRLFARIKKAYGIDLPLAVLFQAPTIEKCAEMLRRDLGIELLVEAKSRPRGSSPAATAGERAFSHVVSIQEGNGATPFFCVHGAGGNVLNFRLLAQHLGSEQPFFGLQARGVAGEAPLETVEEMASLYLEEIRAVRPDGPYLLGGYSGGGVVAYEMAQRLRAEGANVPLLVFLDTFHPSSAPRKITFSERMDRLLREGPLYLARHGKGKLTRHLNELSTELKLLFYTSNDLPLPLELREHRLFGAFRDAASRYRPEPYAGRVLMFRARLIDEIYRHMGPTLGWAKEIPQLEIIEVPGGHDSLVLEPNVQVLTAHLAQAIAQATSAKGGGAAPTASLTG